jgi:methionyl aminopeptidase
VSRATVGRSNADLTAVLHATLEGACLKPSRDFVGHQIGSAPRKSPQVPCAIGISSGAPSPLEEGMVLSLLVIAHAGQPDVMVAEDGWNVIARDGTRSALFSHLVVVRKGKAETLTSEYR